MANVIFKVGTKALFTALEQKDTNTLYWLIDTKEIYKGDVLFGTGSTATEAAAGLLSAEDKAKLDALASGSFSGLTPVDATIVIADGEAGAKTIGVQISKEPGNQLQVKPDGIYVAGNGTVDAPEYIIKKLDTATEGFSASYQLQKTVGKDSTLVGDIVNIPKDLVVQSGSIQTVTEADVPYSGAQVGDTYIDLVLNDPDASHIYIPTKGLVDTSNFATAESVSGIQAVIDSLPEEFMSEITSVERTETTNVAQIRLSIKQPDGTYSTSDEHGVLTLIGAGQGVDGKQGAGLMTLADKQKLDSIDTEVIAGLAESLVWGSL